MEPNRRYRRLYNYFAEVSNKEVYRVQQKNVLHHLAVLIDGIEYGRHIHQQTGKDAPKILDISEENEQGREYQSHAYVEQDQAANRH